MSMKKKKTEKGTTRKPEKSSAAPVKAATVRSQQKPAGLGKTVGNIIGKVKACFTPGETAEA